MPEEEKKPEEQNETKTESEAIDFLKQVEDMKKNYVSKEKFDALQKNYNDLAKGVLDGSLEIEKEKEANTINKNERMIEISKILTNPDDIQDYTNLEFTKLMLEQRNLMIEEGLGDPFLPNLGRTVEKGAVITDFDVQSANKVAETLDKLVKESEGDAEYFNSLLKRTMN